MPPPTIITNTPITPAAAALQTSTVGEPSVSANGLEVLYSGNWFAAHSANAGQTWNLMSPFTFFPAAAGGFCCDQTLIFIPKLGVHVWVLQYVKANNTNVLRIAFKPKQLGTAGGWKWWDLVPANVNPQWASEWFDYNHCAISDNFLYVGTNMFTGATDSLYLRKAGISMYGTSGIFGDIDDSRAHGKDERILVQSFFDGQEYLYRLTKAFTTVPQRQAAK